MWWGSWVWIVWELSLNELIEKARGEGTVSSFVPVLLKLVKPCWVYLEEGAVFLNGVVPLRGIAF